ncbi:JJJ2 [[Candida] subhashii]|uniref:JJJ2 n=1 Tax=[Candida] subhashii TaxID=561895 RepID=A0A8J5QGD4_9ASCO|nr:JJJ2 [[Candida] subhashii]KAG7664071.1 JJJ2 [[Candida] subhashii]
MSASTYQYFQTLGIPPTSSLDEVKKAYKKLSLKYHPDKTSNKEHHEMFIKIKEAYEALKDNPFYNNNTRSRQQQPEESSYMFTSGGPGPGNGYRRPGGFSYYQYYQRQNDEEAAAQAERLRQEMFERLRAEEELRKRKEAEELRKRKEAERLRKEMQERMKAAEELRKQEAERLRKEMSERTRVEEELRKKEQARRVQEKTKAALDELLRHQEKLAEMEQKRKEHLQEEHEYFQAKSQARRGVEKEEEVRNRQYNNEDMADRQYRETKERNARERENARQSFFSYTDYYDSSSHHGGSSNDPIVVEDDDSSVVVESDESEEEEEEDDEEEDDEQDEFTFNSEAHSAPVDTSQFDASFEAGQEEDKYKDRSSPLASSTTEYYQDPDLMSKLNEILESELNAPPKPKAKSKSTASYTGWRKNGSSSPKRQQPAATAAPESTPASNIPGQARTSYVRSHLGTPNKRYKPSNIFKMDDLGKNLNPDLENVDFSDMYESLPHSQKRPQQKENTTPPNSPMKSSKRRIFEYTNGKSKAETLSTPTNKNPIRGHPVKNEPKSRIPRLSMSDLHASPSIQFSPPTPPNPNLNPSITRAGWKSYTDLIQSYQKQFLEYKQLIIEYQQERTLKDLHYFEVINGSSENMNVYLCCLARDEEVNNQYMTTLREFVGTMGVYNQNCDWIRIVKQDDESWV